MFRCCIYCILYCQSWPGLLEDIFAAVGRVRLMVEPNADGKQKRRRAIKLNANKRLEDLPSTNANPCDSGELKKRPAGQPKTLHSPKGDICSATVV